jgi:hypothetical protein
MQIDFLVGIIEESLKAFEESMIGIEIMQVEMILKTFENTLHKLLLPIRNKTANCTSRSKINNICDEKR